MSKMTRKEFLGLSAAAVTSAVLGKSQSASARQEGTATGDGARATLIRGADVLTMDPALGEMSGADVRVENGRITAVGNGLSTDRAEVVDGEGMILMPGMCDGHRHLWHTVDAGRLVKTQPRLYATYQQWKMRTIVSMRPEDHYLAGYMGGLMAIDSGSRWMLTSSKNCPVMTVDEPPFESVA